MYERRGIRHAIKKYGVELILSPRGTETLGARYADAKKSVITYLCPFNKYCKLVLRPIATVETVAL